MEKLVQDADAPSNEPDVSDTAQHLRMAEALLFAAAEPLDDNSLATRLPNGVDIPALMKDLSERYEGRGVNLVKVAGKWAFRTAPDLAFLLEKERTTVRRLSKAALETLAIVAYHQPVTRAEIEEIRGVGISRGTLDMLLEVGWVRLRGRRRTPGRPVTYGTTEDFLDHFGLEGLDDMPGVGELKKSGLLRPEPPTTLFPRRDETAELEDTEPHDPASGGTEPFDTDPRDTDADDTEPEGTDPDGGEGPPVIEPIPVFEEEKEAEEQPTVTGEATKAPAMADASYPEAAPRQAPSRDSGPALEDPILSRTADPESD